MRLPRDLTGAELIKRLARLGYRATRQTGSHVRLSSDAPQPHHLTVPNHDPLKVGTLAAEHQGCTKEELLRRLEL